jgi:LacI family transcriptional regulator
MAIGALSALREAGVAVPEDMAVAGFDDIPIAQYTSPPLTSVHVPIAELGERATARLVEQLGSERKRRRQCETLQTKLVVRQSCGGSTQHTFGRFTS